MLTFEDKIMTKNPWECKRFFARRLIKEFSLKIKKNEKRTLNNFL